MRRTLATVTVAAALITGMTVAAPAAVAAPTADSTAIARATPGADRFDVQIFWINTYPDLVTCVTRARELIGPDYGWWCAPVSVSGEQYPHDLYMFISTG